MKKEVIFLIVLLLVPFCSASNKGIIFTNELQGVYSMRDNINVEFTVEKDITSSGFVEVVLDCEGDDLVVYRKYQEIKSDFKNDFSIDFPALLKGDCGVIVKFSGFKEKSQEFEISDRIDVDYDLSSKYLFPLENLLINGTAIKKNKDLLEGIVKISLDDMNKTFEVSEGEFSASFDIKKDTPPGEYRLLIEAIEKDADNVVFNHGEVSEVVEVKSKPTSISLDIDESIRPPTEISINPCLLDQAGGLIKNESLIIKLFDPNRDIVFEETIKSNENLSYFFTSNSTRGGWEMNVYHGSIFLSKPIYIEDNKELDIEIVNSSGSSFFKITNIGNMDYEGVVNVLFKNSTGEEKVPINVNLKIRETDDYPIELIGNYNLSVQEGEKKFEFRNVYLTGASVFPEMKIGFWSFFIFFLILIAFIVFFLIKKGFFLKIAGLFKKDKKHPEKISKKVYMCFCEFEKWFDVSDFLKKYNLSFNKINDKLYFIIFYSSKKHGEKLFKFAEDLM
ncbi:hypothetical protein GF386_05255, partial [Candidatus Pacearchaeota archaeon]|nr:hypothetical protein [Candidatus Pacearchaeota archaeon]